MSTHFYTCVSCGAETSCHSDSYVLACGGGCYGAQKPIAFCSLECFLRLSAEMWERFDVARELAESGEVDWS